MNGFNRKNQLLSLCGLNCGLCTMYLGNYCPGCGGGAGNQSCKIAKCSLEHGKIEYCYECGEYPCEKYEDIEKYDSFITHKNQKIDLERAKQIGISAYNAEQTEKIKILNTLLTNYNDGRRKTLFCVGVNLLSLQELEVILQKISDNSELDGLSLKEKSAYVAELFQDTAKKKEIELKLRKKKGNPAK